MQTPDVQSFSLLVWNVHGWRNRARQNTIQLFLDFLRINKPDIICFQEVKLNHTHSVKDGSGYISPLNQITNDLSFTPFTFGSNNGICGSALLSKFTNKKILNETIKPKDKILLGNTYNICSDLSISIYCIRLENKNEDIRLAQLKYCMQRINTDKNQFKILCGDFNSLNRSDYTEEEWNFISETRAKSKWESPESNVTSHLQNELGYIDSWKLAKQTQGKINQTCWAGTRVDYVWLSKELAEKITVTDCIHFNDITHSDHIPIKITFEIKDNI